MNGLNTHQGGWPAYNPTMSTLVRLAFDDALRDIFGAAGDYDAPLGPSFLSWCCCEWAWKWECDEHVDGFKLYGNSFKRESNLSVVEQLGYCFSHCGDFGHGCCREDEYRPIESAFHCSKLRFISQWR